MASSPDPRRELANLFEREIPLTRAMSVRVLAAGSEGVTLAAPLAPNLNYTGTAFGGSLGALLVLAGWAYLWLLLQRKGISGWVVVQESHSVFLQPVTREFEASCLPPTAAALAQFETTLRRWGRARIVVDVVIGSAASPAVRFRGTYVAFTGTETSVGGA